jgi:hypothetical protein
VGLLAKGMESSREPRQTDEVHFDRNSESLRSAYSGVASTPLRHPDVTRQAQMLGDQATHIHDAKRSRNPSLDRRRNEGARRR